eukprot:1151168-Pelagomonas_calceolata.AAC.4
MERGGLRVWQQPLAEEQDVHEAPARGRGQRGTEGWNTHTHTHTAPKRGICEGSEVRPQAAFVPFPLRQSMVP